MDDPLADPLAKIRRAEQHLLALNNVWGAWQKSYPYYVQVQFNEDKTYWEFSVKRYLAASKPEDDVFGLLVGDYVHNLRSALDQIVWQIVTVANGRNVKWQKRSEVYFPIVGARKHPRDFWNLPPLTYLTLEQGVFIEGFQAYRRTDFPRALAQLNDMWNADKHRLINPVEVRLAPERGLVVEVVRDCKIIETFEDHSIPLEGEAKVGWARTETTGDDPLVEVQNLRIQVLLGEGKWRMGHLAAFRDLALEILEGSRRFF